MRTWIVFSLMATVAAACSPASESASDTAAPVNVAAAPLADSLLAMTVYKSQTCGCCAAWVDHVKQAGFRVTVVDTSNLEPIKARYGILPGQGSCHTATVGGYVIEGHVPAADIRRLLSERPQVAGLAVPGMPAGSPGMEGPTAQRYDVLAFTRQGTSTVWAKH
jgi:hypothetical protein